MFLMELGIRGAFEIADYESGGDGVQIQIHILFVLLIYYLLLIHFYIYYHLLMLLIDFIELLLLGIY